MLLITVGIDELNRNGRINLAIRDACSNAVDEAGCKFAVGGERAHSLGHTAEVTRSEAEPAALDLSRRVEAFEGHSIDSGQPVRGPGVYAPRQVV